MKQILQNLGTGETLLVEVPCPQRASGAILIEASKSLVSLGTEKMLIDFGKAGWLAKARQQPDKVKQVLQKIKTDGLWTTIDAVRAKLDQPIPLGYSNVGQVVAGEEGTQWRAGERVVSNGPHAEMVSSPSNLVARIPESVTDEQAAFTVVGAIGLQGIRLLAPTLGERFVVSGLGLIGLLCVQMLRAHGCEVLGIDYDTNKLKLAQQFGAEIVDLSQGQDPYAVAMSWSKGIGVDGVLITASTKSDEVVHQAAKMCRKRGRIVLVGVVGLNLRRADFYEKELTFQVSCSYGPGRYDPEYEKRGLDYPIGFVRWTEQRNFEAVLGLMATGKLDVLPLVSHRFDFDEALKAYDVVGQGGALGVVLNYTAGKTCSAAKQSRVVSTLPSSTWKDLPSVAFIGAGGFATRMLMPILAKQSIRRHTVVSNSGVSATHAARKFRFEQAASDVSSVLGDPNVDAVFIATPHNSHARLVCQSLEAGKHVFVEKPLTLTLEELTNVEQVCCSHRNCCLLTGFNRRFSPHSRQMAKWLQSVTGSRAMVITVNAGHVSNEHWVHDSRVGGGRIVGEGCHFIDLARYLVGAPIAESSIICLGGITGHACDCASMNLKFTDGSIATIHYLANGHKAFPKERVEIFAGGNVIQCDNFRVSKNLATGKSFKTRYQDKGHSEEILAFLNCVKHGGDWPISLDEQLEVSRVAIQLAQQV